MVRATLDRVVHCIAAATRYPTELLIANADLENDLGIDSVKNLEILLALAEEFGVELTQEVRDPNVRTIGDVARWIEQLLESKHPREPQSHPMQRAERSSAPSVRDNHAQDNRARGRTADSMPSPHFSIPAPHFAMPALDQEPPTRAGSRPLQTLQGRVALVTGSGRGVGRTIARLLASRGAHVIVNSFHSRELGEQTETEIRAQGGQATHIWGSVANPEHVERIFAQIEQQFGRLDVLVCNASDGRIGPFLELTQKDWERAFSTNVTGHYHCALKAARLMQSGGGSIVTMSAVGANRYIDGLGSQGVVKAAVETLTRYLACELGRWGIRVNCVAGGPVYGELLSKFPDAQATQGHWESITADGELCSPMDLANAIGFLVSDDARGINGAVWTVDHGFSARADGRPIRAAQPAPMQFAAI